MLMIAGFILLAVAVAMIYRFMRNSKRPRMEMKIEEIVMQHSRFDKKQISRTMPHAVVNYNFEGHKYKSTVMILKKAQVGDWIQVSVNPENPELLDLYSPQKEKLAILVVAAIGAILIGGSFFLIDYLDAW